MRPAISYAILCAGEFPGNPYVRESLMSSDVVICCDGAATSFMRFRKPDFIVGDLDSLPESVREDMSDRIFHIGEQESNDLSKAFRWICSLLRLGDRRSEPPFSITVYGATGKREDHTLGNISLLADFASVLNERHSSGKLCMVTDYGMFLPVLDSCRMTLAPGQDVSIFAFDPSLRVASTGLEYPTDEVRFDMWWKATLNRASGGTVEMRFNHPAKALLYFPGMSDNKLDICNL